MKHPILFLIPLTLIGCGSPNPPESKPTEPETADAPQPEAVRNERPDFPPDNLIPLTPPGLLGKFYHVSFAWGNGPGNWEYMTREERGQALFGNGGGFTRNEYNRGAVRIREVYYDPEHIKMRWQEELRGGEWVRHGPEVYWRVDGSGGDILFRLDGEAEGNRLWFDADGKMTHWQEYEKGVALGPVVDATE